MNPRRLANPAFLIAMIVMASSAAGWKAAIDHYKFYLRKLEIFPEEGRLVRVIPGKTRSWVQIGSDETVDADTLEMLGTDNYVSRNYVQRDMAGGKPKVVKLHVAYYTGMIDTVPHVPERRFVGAGLNLMAGPVTLPIKLDTSDWLASPDAPPGSPPRLYTTRLSNEYTAFGGGRRVNLPIDVTPDSPLSLRISEFSGPSGAHNVSGYLFLGNGGWVSTAEGVRLLSFHLTDDYAYYLKIQVGSSDVSSPQELADLASSLLSDLMGEIMMCVPDWPKVQRGDWPPDNPKRKQTGPASGT